MSDLNDLDALVTRMARVRVALDELPEGPSPERYSLLTELDELRRQAETFDQWDLESRSTVELSSELDALTSRREQIVSGRIGFATSTGGGNHSPTPGSWVDLATKARDAAGLDRINARIGRIEDELTKRHDAAGK
jgi:hypothetical protein